jgi:hypothetical protein
MTHVTLLFLVPGAAAARPSGPSRTGRMIIRRARQQLLLLLPLKREHLWQYIVGVGPSRAALWEQQVALQPFH